MVLIAHIRTGVVRLCDRHVEKIEALMTGIAPGLFHRKQAKDAAGTTAVPETSPRSS